jgi:hypothetical protein
MSFLVIIAVCMLSLASVLWAQVSEEQLKAFVMPPPQGYRQQTVFSFPGAYGYFTEPKMQTDSVAYDQNEFAFVRYGNVKGKVVHMFGQFGPIPIPKPVDVGGVPFDGCTHTHSTYGIWKRMTLPAFQAPPLLIGVPSRVVWVFVGGGGRTGVRHPDGSCRLSADPLEWAQWGQEEYRFDYRNERFVDELVLGVLSVTYGWGNCPSKFCTMPSFFRGWTDK